MSAESRLKIVAVALGVCIVCSILVSTAAVVLNARQEENKKIEKIKNILIAGNLYEKGKDVKKIYNSNKKPVTIDNTLLDKSILAAALENPHRVIQTVFDHRKPARPTPHHDSGYITHHPEPKHTF